MKLYLACVFFILLSGATRNLCAFKIQTEVQKDLVSLDTYKAEPAAETSALQMLLQRPKRFTALSLCMYCCKCCKNKGCGYCCRT